MMRHGKGKKKVMGKKPQPQPQSAEGDAAGCRDDKAGYMAEAGYPCPMITKMVSCDTDLHQFKPDTTPKGTYLYDMCPLSCKRC